VQGERERSHAGVKERSLQNVQRTLPLFDRPTKRVGEYFDFTAENVASPAAYEGVLAFHKYWGKKPIEPLSFVIERITERGDLVIDPFSGSGVTGFASVGLQRRFLGIDINPIAVRLSSFVLNPPAVTELKDAFNQIEQKVRKIIEASYSTSTIDKPATHYLWQNDLLKEVWVVEGRRRIRTAEPSAMDYEQVRNFNDYYPKFRNPRFFKNSRINSDPDLNWRSLFTGRALRNIEVLLDAIRELPRNTRAALELCLTAAIGQMSKMVFAITGRGKKKGSASSRIEVGSWVIGFWRPPLHFEINVWNCFGRKFEKLLSGVTSLDSRPRFGDIQQVINRRADCAVLNESAVAALSQLPDGSADLILTDPPHSDRAPYLELSELWNAVLGLHPHFDDEIVVSNARDRDKTVTTYTQEMQRFASVAVRKLNNKGCIVIQFNARGHLSWEFLRAFESSFSESGIRFRGTFPIKYSANSVVQDNRDGALTTDYCLIFGQKSLDLSNFASLKGWTNLHPRSEYHTS
jgi:DNA methylase